MRLDKLTAIWKKYRYAALVLLAGIVLMALPTSGRKKEASEKAACQEAVSFSLEETEKKMESVLGQIDGVGKLRIMLTLASGPQLQLAEDTDLSRGSAGGDERARQEIVTLNRGSGYQEVIVTRQSCPVYRGAVVVCEGADSSAVRLAVTEAVAALTGLTSERISILKWNKA